PRGTTRSHIARARRGWRRSIPTPARRQGDRRERQRGAWTRRRAPSRSAGPRGVGIPGRRGGRQVSLHHVAQARRGDITLVPLGEAQGGYEGGHPVERPTCAI